MGAAVAAVVASIECLARLQRASRIDSSPAVRQPGDWLRQTGPATRIRVSMPSNSAVSSFPCCPGMVQATS
jgi:hypothetical protein